MAERKTNTQRSTVEKKMEQLKAQRKAIIAREKAAERKARTKRLIEIGAEVEAALGYSLDTKEMILALGEFLRSQEQRGKFVTRAVKENLK